MILFGTVSIAWDLRMKPTYFNEGRDVRHGSTMLLIINITGFSLAHFIVSPQELPKFLVITLTILLSASPSFKNQTPLSLFFFKC